MNIRLLVLLAACTGLTACGQKRIDASNQDKMTKSVEEVRASLPADQRTRFDEALRVLVTKDFDIRDMFSGNTTTLEAKMREAVNGKSGQEVIAVGEAILTKRRAKERQQAESEIADLKRKQHEAERAKTELKKFRVTRSRFYKQKQEFGGSEPIIELAITNDTPIPVSRVYFMGTLASPGRAVPWLKESFNYQIPGGMEPAESKELKLAPNIFGEWGRADAPPDAIAQSFSADHMTL
jgi:hypothetical protein